MALVKNQECFCCGPKNPYGLHLKHQVLSGGAIRIEFVAAPRYQGWANILHGGVYSLIFDELLGRISYEMGYDGMTARMEVRYRHPVMIGETIIFLAELDKHIKNLLEVKLTARKGDGTLVAEGTGRVLIKGARAPHTLAAGATPSSP